MLMDREVISDDELMRTQGRHEDPPPVALKAGQCVFTS